MAALADLEDIEGSEDFSPTQVIEARKALERASTRVRVHCRREFDIQEFTTRIRARANWLTLSQTPVVSITSVAILVNGVPTPTPGWIWDGLNRVWVGSLGIVVNLPEDVLGVVRHGPIVADVTYTAGYEVVPPAVVEVVAGLAQRSVNIPLGGLVNQQSAGPFQVTVAPWASGGPLTLSAGDLATLAPFRKTRGSVEVGIS